MERAIHTNLNPKSPNNASFSSPYHLTSDQPNKSETNHPMRPYGLRALDHDPTSELNTFGAHKYFNHGTNNDNIQKVTMNSNSRVSPLLNMDTEHKHNPEQGDITKSTMTNSASSSASGNGKYNNIINNYKAHSFHIATPTPPPSSSKSTLNNKAGLLFHHPQKNTNSVTNPPRTSSNLTKKLRISLSKPIWLLRRKCPCNDKKSVQVKGNTHKNSRKPKISPPPQPQSLSHNQIHKDSLNHKASPPTSSSSKELKSKRLFQFRPAMIQARRPSSESLAFPFVMAKNPTKPHQVLLNVVHEEEDTTPRESLHVFQPPSPSKSRAMDDDAASDASSDLFEIESFSTQSTTLPYIPQCHEITDHEFFFAADAGSSLWRRRRLRDTEVLPPL